MPTPLLRSLAKKSGKTLVEVEKLWSQAKKIAEAAGQKDNYAYIVAVLEKKLGLR